MASGHSCYSWLVTGERGTSAELLRVTSLPAAMCLHALSGCSCDLMSHHVFMSLCKPWQYCHQRFSLHVYWSGGEGSAAFRDVLKGVRWSDCQSHVAQSQLLNLTTLPLGSFCLAGLMLWSLCRQSTRHATCSSAQCGSSGSCQSQKQPSLQDSMLL
jgi:hypothetical protein